ncbi:MAG: hypothetical protein EPO08_07090 [Rhodospirillaceae bacterium]|nr:MAG: hypothetical protein EPO08_07090 [Rhodospirillaceae bacterium]
MHFWKRLYVGAVFLCLMAAVSAAHAEPKSTDDLFKEFIFDGCFPALTTGIPVDAFARSQHLVPADSHLADAFLHGRKGSAYIHAVPENVVIIAEGADGYCTVATQFAPGVLALQKAVETTLMGSGMGFTPIKEDQRQLGGALSTTREYDGRIGTQPLGVLFSITETGPPPQAVLSVYRKAR